MRWVYGPGITPFLYDTYEVTTAEYLTNCQYSCETRVHMSESRSTHDQPNHPVNFISNKWGAQMYCEVQYKRLPTIAEWRVAARGFDGSLYPWGDQTPSCEYAVIDVGGDGCGTDKLMAVGSKPNGVSPYGIHDLVGNAEEMLNDQEPQYVGTDYYATAGGSFISPSSSDHLRLDEDYDLGNTKLEEVYTPSSDPDWSARFGFRCVSD